jgi:hypothetical protein
MKTIRLLLVSVLVSVALLAATSTTPATAANPECGFVGSGHPGCRIVNVASGEFQTPLIVASASFWLQLEFACTALDPAVTDVVIDYEGTFFSESISLCVAGSSIGQLLQLPGNYVVEYRNGTTGELLDTLQITLRA